MYMTFVYILLRYGMADIEPRNVMYFNLKTCNLLQLKSSENWKHQ